MADVPNDSRYQSFLGAVLNDSALVALARDDLKEAVNLLQQADTHQQAALQVDRQNLRFRAFARNHQEMLAVALMRLGRRSEAERILRQCISIGEKLASDFPLVPRYREEVAGSYGNLATLLIGMGPDRREEAARVFDQAGKLILALVGEYPGVRGYRQDLAKVRNNMGHLFRDARRWKDAEQSYCEAIELARGARRRRTHEYSLQANPGGLSREPRSAAGSSPGYRCR